MTFEEYEKAAVSTAIYPGQGTAIGMMYCALKLNGEAGELAEHIGKAMRDDSLVEMCQGFTNEGGVDTLVALNDLTVARDELVKKEIGDCLWYLAALARERGTSLAAIAQGNIDKLAARKATGTLGGSGDNR